MAQPAADLDGLSAETHGLKPNEGLPEFLEWADAQGLKKAAVTNAPRSGKRLMHPDTLLLRRLQEL